jgi:hypothetical protein
VLGVRAVDGSDNVQLTSQDVQNLQTYRSFDGLPTRSKKFAMTQSVTNVRVWGTNSQRLIRGDSA